MAEAVKEAKIAGRMGEVPIGAVIVLEGRIIARGHNLKEHTKDATDHAEIVTIKKAVAKTGHWRHLQEAALYVTIEPCPMCAGAIVQSRIKTLVFGAKDPKAGAAGSTVNLLQNQVYNHSVEVVSGVLADECAALMQEFFQKLRIKD